jgi:hypothetical protein
MRVTGSLCGARNCVVMSGGQSSALCGARSCVVMSGRKSSAFHQHSFPFASVPTASALAMFAFRFLGKFLRIRFYK